jgi:hypothetical protein
MARLDRLGEAKEVAQIGAALRAYAHDDFPDRPLANGRNSLQQRRITSWGIEKYLEIWSR